MFLEYGNVYPYIGWVFCAGTLYSGLPQHNRNSTIGVWHSTDGGVTWSAPDAVDAPPQAVGCDGDIASHSCIFDDKPAITMSQANGVVFVPFTRTTASYTDQNTGQGVAGTTAVYMAELLPTRGWAAIGQIGESNMAAFAGPTPVVDPTTNICHLFMRGLDQSGNPVIRTFTSGDGWIWTENINSYDQTPDRAPAPGFFPQTVLVNNTPVEAVPFMTAKFDNAYHHIVVVYHRQENGLTQVVYRRYSPFSHAWTQAGTIAANGHPQWNPTLVQLSNYHWIISYYDYTPGDTGYTLYAARQDLYTNVVENSRIFNLFLSNPAGYNRQGGQISQIGEYQGLTQFNDTIYAATTQINSGVGNAWVVKFTSP